MRRSLLWLFIASTCWLQTSAASAHFLFIRIGQHAEAGRTVEVFFSERAEAGDPKFVAKIAHTKLWMQTDSDKLLPLKVRQGTERLRAFLPLSTSTSVVGVCEYGVLQRKVPFLLRYYPKAISGDPQELNGHKPWSKIPLQIVAKISGDSVTLTALNRGRPVPNATFTTVDDDLANEELKADKSGKVVWKPSDPGHYCVYTHVVTDEAGEHKGRRYTEIREYATLAFHWPLNRQGPDDEAVAQFEQAIAARANWVDFPGFTADTTGIVDGREFDGTVKIDDEGTVHLKIDEKSAVEWVEDQLGSIVLHRKAPSTPRKKKPVLRFADNDERHPLGRLLTFVGGSMAASYRVKDKQLTVVNRNIGPQNMTITVLENQKNVDGKFLPRAYTVQYWSAQTGQLLRAQTIQNRWTRVGSFDLPTSLVITTASESGLSVRKLELSKHKLLAGK